MPVRIPKPKAANNNARNGWILNFVDEKTINRIHIIRTMITSIVGL